MSQNLVGIILRAAIVLHCIAQGLPAAEPDPYGIVIKPIPDKLVVLTFDDGPASHATIVAPILKSLGFGGSFYVCDFDSFKTRKDWYMTFRQMKALADAGFEIGNHTRGHYGSLNAFLDMEDELAAHDVPKPTTVCWPLYAAGWSICPDLTKNGWYTFGRGGHDRPYRPTADNPFDVPSFTIRDGLPVETFIKQARQACRGRVVVFTFHGVPDMEHAAVGLEPETFKVMMQYLKDNHYQCIAMRDLTQYIDPAKAAKLPPTANAFQESGPAMLAKEDKPYVAAAKDTQKSYSPGRPPVNTPKPSKTPVGKADDLSQIYAATAVISSQPNAFVWSKAEGGNWSDGSKWSNNGADGSAPLAAGQADYALHFKAPGTHTVTNDLNTGFLLNRLDLTPVQGQGLTLAGNAIALTTNKVTGALPSIHEHTVFGRDKIDAPIILGSDVAVNLVPAGQLTIAGLISGTGRLIYTGGNGNASGDLNGGPNQHYSNLSINHSANTYSGGTVINGGTLRLATSRGLGTGPITLNEGGGLVPASGIAVNPLILNGGVLDAAGVDWNAPITLNGNIKIAGHKVNLNKAAGGISGPGGFTQIGTWGAFGRVNAGEVYLWGMNTYAGSTTVHQGTLFVKKPASLYNADSANWTAAKISIHPAATLVISAGGPGEFTGAQVGTLLGNLAASVDNNGLMAGAVFGLDTANAKEPVTVSTVIADSKGASGGAFTFKKLGGGTLRLLGENTYTGRTIVDGGALSVVSINRVVSGQASSGLGAPTTLENGIIDFDGDCTLTYIGRGEVTDRIIDLAGEQQTVTFDQSGSGLLKFTSPFDISGYGFNKIIVLTGFTAGTGEFAGSIKNPYDRKGVARTSLTKTGTGTWTLSGSNSYTGLTTVAQGTLSVASAESLGPKTEVIIASSATLDLNFNGRLKVRGLSLGGEVQPPGAYSAARYSKFIGGTGILIVQP